MLHLTSSKGYGQTEDGTVESKNGLLCGSQPDQLPKQEMVYIIANFGVWGTDAMDSSHGCRGGRSYPIAMTRAGFYKALM